MLKGLFLVIVLFLYWAFFKMILEDLEKKTKEKIQSIGRKNALEAIKLRRKLFTRRILLLVGIVLFFATVLSSLTVFTDKELMTLPKAYSIGLWFLCFFLFSFICAMPIWSNFKVGDIFFGNVSLLTLDDVLSDKKPFYLYLRGFDYDDKRTLSDVKDSAYEKGFSEYVLVKGLKKQVKQVYAVGRPEETDSPYGATRVYIDNEGWRDSVAVLMERAEKIYVRSCYTNDCCWEIETALSTFVDKTVFIIDNMAEYNLIRQSIVELPEIDGCINEWTIYLLCKLPDGQWIVEKLKKRKSGYVKVSGATDDGKPSMLLQILKYIIIVLILILFIVVRLH